MKKIALIGNMNNNFFSMMRYFRDNGYAADLFLFNDESSHFLPINDTWDIDKWEKYIFNLPISNNENTILKNNLGEIKKLLNGYDFYIGCGITPALFEKIGLKLDVFIPYAYGIEFYGAHKFRLFHLIDEIKFRIAKFYQVKGMLNTRHIICPDYSLKFKEVFKSLKRMPTILQIPMVYLEKPPTKLPENIYNIIKKFKLYDMILFSHVAHKWKKIPKSWLLDTKKNQVLIKGFAKYIKSPKRTISKPLLVLLEYGYDIPASKSLISELGISEYVLWLSLLSRKEIMVLLDYVNLGGGEFGGAIWGGTGWEFISKGVPFFQYVKIDPLEYEKLNGCPMPSFLNVSTEDEILNHLLNYEINKDYYKNIGNSLKEWFRLYNGNNLIKKYIDILENKNSKN
jgi:hypothetical protein